MNRSFVSNNDSFNARESVQLGNANIDNFSLPINIEGESFLLEINNIQNIEIIDLA